MMSFKTCKCTGHYRKRQVRPTGSISRGPNLQKKTFQNTRKEIQTNNNNNINNNNDNENTSNNNNKNGNNNTYTNNKTNNNNAIKVKGGFKLGCFNKQIIKLK